MKADYSTAKSNVNCIAEKSRLLPFMCFFSSPLRLYVFVTQPNRVFMVISTCDYLSVYFFFIFFLSVNCYVSWTVMDDTVYLK
ncbi:Uncharacterized protein APZ42_018265 [Daphnia magna]|uniref:Uncharacterized protein n=1 Tax=Daphnia magna TaxID=35525 RepID=A0A164Z887_9CRUS|nr:Uncharacterized protein APZ42_018265 [Daphnia magna]